MTDQFVRYGEHLVTHDEAVRRTREYATATAIATRPAVVRSLAALYPFYVKAQRFIDRINAEDRARRRAMHTDYARRVRARRRRNR